MKKTIIAMLSIVLMLFAFASCSNDSGNPPFEGDRQEVANQLKPADLVKEVLEGNADGVDVEYELIPQASAALGSRALDAGNYILRATVTFKSYATDAGTIIRGVLVYDMPGRVNASGSFTAGGTCSITTETELVVETESGDEVPVTITDESAAVRVSLTIASDDTVTNVNVTVTVSDNISATVADETVTVPPETPAYDPEPSTPFDGGNGTESSPYLISSQSQFIAMADYGNSYFRLTRDLELTADVYIQDFYGNLDGDNNTITYVSSDSANQFLFYALRDGSVIRNLNIEAGEIEKALAYCTEGDVLLDNVNISGNFTPSGNNFGPYIIYLGYDSDTAPATRLPANLTIKNCTNKTNVIDYSGTVHGLSPFVHGFPMPNVEAESTLTLENCVNDAKIFGGRVGWVFGNQSDVEKVGKVTVTDCSNGDNGSVIGVLDNGDFSWNNKQFRDTDDIDPNFTNMTSKAPTTSMSATADIPDAVISVSTPLPDDTELVEFIVGYQVTGYTADNDTLIHMSQYLTLTDEDATDGTYIFDTLTAVDSEFSGVEGTPETGDVITIDNAKYIYIGNVLGGSSGTVHSCLDRPSVDVASRIHTAAPEFIYIVCLDSANDIIGHGKVAITE